MNKLLGLNFGRDKGECSKYLNLAIESARQDGADVQIINCCNLKIDRCQGCGACSSGSRLHGKPVMCIVKDDYEMVKEAILDADAIIVAAPVYVLGPAGQLKNLIDRLGPAHDRAAMWKEFMKRVDPVPDPQNPGQLKQRDEIGLYQPLDPREIKQRYVAYISLGGAQDHHWVSMGLTQMKLFGFPVGMHLVDELDIHGAHGDQNPRTIMFKARAEKLGHNVASALGKYHREVPWHGDEKGVCPVCHGRMITITKGTNVECPLCGITGNLVIENGAIKVKFSFAELDRSRFNLTGLLEHTGYGNLVEPPRS